MTTIACNKEAIYGDRQYTNHVTGLKWRGGGKVFRFKAHPRVCDQDFIVGFAGIASEIIDVVNYFEHAEMFDRLPRVRNLAGIVLCADGDIFKFDDYTRWMRVKQPFIAIGSGAQYAMAAMDCGKSPEEAVRIAAKHDAWTGMGIKGYRIN